MPLTPDSKPTIPQLLSFEGRTRRINIAVEISMQYAMVGTALLNDTTGAVLPAIVAQNMGIPVSINLQILQKWVQGAGVADRTWKKLVEVLKNNGCQALATDIEDVIAPPAPVKPEPAPPAPVEPEPAPPAPVEPDPPAPVRQEPDPPAPVETEPEPAPPAPVEPDPPAPVQLQPDPPAPVETEILPPDAPASAEPVPSAPPPEAPVPEAIAPGPVVPVPAYPNPYADSVSVEPAPYPQPYPNTGPLNPAPYPNAGQVNTVYPSPVPFNPAYPAPALPYPDTVAINPALYPGPAPVFARPAPANPVYPGQAPVNPVYSDLAPVNPVYSDPAPVNPVYSDPVPVNPVYSDPAPVNPVYSDPAPVNPVYSDPAPVNPVRPDPAPVNPVYSDPAPVNPVYSDPAPVNPVHPDPAPVNTGPSVSPVPAGILSNVQRFTELGLGRGVDATGSNMWAKKSTFTVRRVSHENIVVSDESGLLESYKSEVASLRYQQVELKATVASQQPPVSVGIDAEASRKPTDSGRVNGRRVVNCTVSFHPDIEDPPAVTIAPGGDVQSGVTFEQWLSRWLMEHVLHRQKMETLSLEAKGSSSEPPTRVNVTSNPVSDLTDYIGRATVDQRKEVVQQVGSFIELFHVTHYVTSVQLGAAEFTADGQSDSKSIGRIGDDGSVGRGSSEEAVIGISVEPITSLVKQHFLHLALKQALMKYMELHGQLSGGPYLISCSGKQPLFLTVVSDDDHSVLATEDIRAASPFYLLAQESEDEENFMISFQGDAIPPNPAVQVSYNLLAPLNVLGENSGPLHMRPKLHSNAIFHLRNRVGKGSGTLAEWISGKEPFFVGCKPKSVTKQGYVCVKTVSSKPSKGSRFITACLPKRSKHNEQDTWMLFNLLPASSRDEGWLHDM